jgi:hypothetical protein
MKSINATSHLPSVGKNSFVLSVTAVPRYYYDYHRRVAVVAGLGNGIHLVKYNTTSVYKEAVVSKCALDLYQARKLGIP